MQVVINVPDIFLEWAKDEMSIEIFDNRSMADAMSSAIRNGIVLPSGHGKLIDARKLFKHLFVRDGKVCPDTDIDNFPTTFNARDIKNAILNATTIIEADKAEEDTE